jgi:hypothetical protein
MDGSAGTDGRSRDAGRKVSRGVRHAGAPRAAPRPWGRLGQPAHQAPGPAVTAVETRAIITGIPARLDRLSWARWHWMVVIGLCTACMSEEGHAPGILSSFTGGGAFPGSPAAVLRRRKEAAGGIAT